MKDYYLKIFKSKIYKGITNRLKESFIKNNFPDFYQFIIDNYTKENIHRSFLEKLFIFINGDINKCLECNNKTNFISFSSGYFSFCSYKCSSNNKNVRIKYKKTIQDIYGVDNPSKSSVIKNKKKETVKKNYGVDYHFQSETIKKSIRETLLKNYGVDNAFKSEEIKDKIKNTMLQKYGVEHNSHHKKTQNKKKETNLRKYGKEHFLQTKEFNEISQKKRKKNIEKSVKKYLTNEHKLLNIGQYYEIFHKKCGEIFHMQPQLVRLRYLNNIEICKKCNPFIKKYSNLEKELFSFLEKNKINISGNYKLNKKEIDIYIPELKLGIEFNGLYWHSELYKDKNYHLDKTNECLKEKIKLVHIWEDDWLYKQDIVKSMILNKIGKSPNKIYARKTEIREIVDNEIIRQFLNDNHLQGFVGSKIKIGLFYENKLISLMTFGGLRRNMGQKTENRTYEMLRFCNKKYTNIVGGASRLFKYFNKKYKPIKVISYASRDHSMGKLYETLGFELESITKPNYYYVKDGLRYNRFGFRKDVLVREGYDPNKTEHEIMLERKYYRIYDTGNYKYSIIS